MASGGDEESPGRSPSAARPRRKRNARACDRCHKRSSKCEPNPEGDNCLYCKTHGAVCTYDRPFKRRGPPTRRVQPRRNNQTEEAAVNTPTSNPVQATRIASASGDDVSPSSSMALLPDLYAPYEYIIKTDMIESLVEVFHHLGYPLLPYFHWPTYQLQIQQQLYRSNLGLFVVTMAVCSHAAARLFHSLPIRPRIPCEDNIRLSQQCYDVALESIPKNITLVDDYYSIMKAKAILSSVSLQRGDLKSGIVHLGDYMSLCMNYGLHLESNWPTHLTESDKQQRRRLFWGVYQQEQYIANNFNRVSRQRELKATVLYPAEVFDDSDIDETRVWYRNEEISFLRGWNFCTDLYRLIEHVDNSNRERQNVTVGEPGSAITSFLSRLKTPSHFASDTLSLISNMHRELPSELKKVKALTGDLHADRFGFIASNILITTQTLKMQLIGPEKSSVHQRCAIVSELLDELSTIPVAYFHASNTCSLHHVAHVGHLLGNIVQDPLSPWAYFQVRNLLLVLASFLDRIESNRPPSPGLAAKIRAHVSRIDQLRQEPSQQDRGSNILPLGQETVGRDWTGANEAALVEDAGAASLGEAVQPPPASIGYSGALLPDRDYLSIMDIVQRLDFSAMGAGDPANGQDLLLDGSLDMSQPYSMAQQPSDFFDSWPF